jgi:hypothetical protein
MRKRSLGKMAWTGSGSSLAVPRLFAHSTVFPACAKASISPLRKLTGVGISRTRDSQAASRMASPPAAVR